jgi:hypothetical protein
LSMAEVSQLGSCIESAEHSPGCMWLTDRGAGVAIPDRLLRDPNPAWLAPLLLSLPHRLDIRQASITASIRVCQRL